MALLCSVILELASARGIDLERWFVPVAGWGDDYRISASEFERKLTGLGLGLAAGLSADASREVEAALTPRAIEEVLELAGEGDLVDVARVLGVDPGPRGPTVAAVAPDGGGGGEERARPRRRAWERRAAAEARWRLDLDEALSDLARQGLTVTRLRGAQASVARRAAAHKTAAPLVDGAMLRAALAEHGLRLPQRRAEALVREAASRSGEVARGVLFLLLPRGGESHYVPYRRGPRRARGTGG